MTTPGIKLARLHCNDGERTDGGKLYALSAAVVSLHSLAELLRAAEQRTSGGIQLAADAMSRLPLYYDGQLIMLVTTDHVLSPVTFFSSIFQHHACLSAACLMWRSHRYNCHYRYCAVRVQKK